MIESIEQPILNLQHYVEKTLSMTKRELNQKLFAPTTTCNNIINTKEELRTRIYKRNLKANRSTYKRKMSMFFDTMFDLDMCEIKMIENLWATSRMSEFTKPVNRSWNYDNHVRKLLTFFDYAVIFFDLQGNDNENLLIPIDYETNLIKDTAYTFGTISNILYKHGGAIPRIKHKVTKATNITNWLNIVFIINTQFIKLCRAIAIKSNNPIYSYQKVLTEWRFFSQKTFFTPEYEHRDIVPTQTTIYNDPVHGGYYNNETLCWKDNVVYIVKSTLTIDPARGENNSHLVVPNIDMVLWSASGRIFSSFRMKYRIEQYLNSVSHLVTHDPDEEVPPPYHLRIIPLEIFINLSENPSYWNSLKSTAITISDLNNNLFDAVDTTYSGCIPGYNFCHNEQKYIRNNGTDDDIDYFAFNVAIQSFLQNMRISLRFAWDERNYAIGQRNNRNTRPNNIKLSNFANRQISEWYNNPSNQIIKECPVCIEPVLQTDVKAFTTCGHMFHDSCLTQSLRYKNECPVCKFGS